MGFRPLPPVLHEAATWNLDFGSIRDATLETTRTCSTRIQAERVIPVRHQSFRLFLNGTNTQDRPGYRDQFSKPRGLVCDIGDRMRCERTSQATVAAETQTTATGLQQCDRCQNWCATFDWASTPLGPVEKWPDGLKNTVRILLTSRFSMWMALGSGSDVPLQRCLRANHAGQETSLGSGKARSRGVERDLERHRPAHPAGDGNRRGLLGRDSAC